MQNDKTLAFWDDYYHSRDETSKEWIVHPSDALLKLVLDLIIFDTTSDTATTTTDDKASGFAANNNNEQPNLVIQILELGCGTSTLALELCRYWNDNYHPSSVLCQSTRLKVIATDASPICIEQQIAQQPPPDTTTTTTILEYRTLNITESNLDFLGKFDLILDKGCFDTLLFRSSKKHRERQEVCLRHVLQNIRGWLKPTTRSCYCIVTPRSKIKAIRDFPGFRVHRIVLKDDAFDYADLEPRGGSTTKDKTLCSAVDNEQLFYFHICHYRDAETSRLEQNVGDDTRQHLAPRNDDTCHCCGVCFGDFQKHQNQKSRTERGWTRIWIGHQRHCKKKPV